MYDELTNLGNCRYLEDKYLKYINEHKDANFIMIDLSNFKKINDTFGHEAGDKCLKSFAEKLRTFFKDSLLVRLHGDEFAIVTGNNEDSIKKFFELIDFNIKAEVQSGIIPLIYGFNAGSTKAEKNLFETQDKADYIMYYAKKKKLNYQPFKREIYKVKMKEDSFLSDFDRKLNQEDFSYYGRNLYDINASETKLIQIYTKNSDGGNIFDGMSYETLRKNSQISKFDMFNLQNLIGKISMMEIRESYIVNVDYRSLLSTKGLLEFLKYIRDNTINGLNNAILSIDLSGIETSEFPLTIDLINMLKELGFKIILDKIDTKIPDYLIEVIRPNYIKLRADLWKTGIDNDMKKQFLKYKLLSYSMIDDIIVFFDQIETEKQKEGLIDISPNDTTLYSGNYYSEEKRLVLD